VQFFVVFWNIHVTNNDGIHMGISVARFKIVARFSFKEVQKCGSLY
jgi:hypothetical protein